MSLKERYMRSLEVGSKDLKIKEIIKKLIFLSKFDLLLVHIKSKKMPIL